MALQTDLRRRPPVRVAATPLRAAHPRRKKEGRFWKGFLVVGVASALTTAAINASDGLRIPGVSLLGSIGATAEKSRCPDGMIEVPAPRGGFCVDIYENAPGKACLNSEPKTPQETKENFGNPACAPVAEKGREPWTNVTLGEAQQLCTRAGKRLPTQEEWYRAALGTPDGPPGEPDGCVLGRIGRERADTTGTHPACRSGAGAFDMVGNVWEWIEETAKEGMWDGVPLPSTGYVAEADERGVPTKTELAPEDAFRGDHFGVEPDGTRGVFRGGYWGMDEKAGIYAWNATQPPSFVGVAVGFRCVK